MIDFHTHILPEIDDGAKNIEETFKLIKEAESVGFKEIICTSHYIEGYYESSKFEREEIISAISSSIKEQNIKLKLYLGNEIYFSENIFHLLEEQKACSINDTNYILFELPLNARIKNLENIIYDMQQYKLIPVLAHPERYEFIKENPDMVYNLIKKGVLMQGNFGSIIGQYGEKSKIIIKKLLENHMIHFLGTDVHRANTIYPKMPKILRKIEGIIGKDNLEMITSVNPKLVLENKKVNIVEPRKIEFSFKEKLALKI